MTREFAEPNADKLGWLKWLQFFLVLIVILTVIACSLGLFLISKGAIEESVRSWTILHNLCLMGFVLTALTAAVSIWLAKKKGK